MPSFHVPEGLGYEQVTLRFDRFEPEDEDAGLSPMYVFKILDPSQTDVGHISFKVGDTWHITYAVGHIGYHIERGHRGHGYAYQACRALAPFAKTVYERLIITTHPSNAASIRTI